MRSNTRAVRTAALAAVSLAILAAQPAHAAAVHERGTVSVVAGSLVTVKSQDGKNLTFDLGDGWKVGGLEKGTMADIKPGTFIGTATSGDDTDMKALEVVVFPESMRGTGEGHYAWDLGSKSMMTNANVDNAVKGVDGQTVTLSYKGGEKKVQIKDTTPIVKPVDATKADLVPGAKVFIVTPGESGGKLEAGRVVVGKDGITPPM